YYRMADLCAVTSLHDGMNLVAKEYLAASPDLEGALILSPFTGAARELERAFLASPYDREGTAAAFLAALTEPEDARRERMWALDALVALLIAFIGWGVARLVASGVRWLLHAARFNDGMRRLLGDVPLRYEPTALVAWAVQWTIVLLTVMLCADVLGFDLTRS